MQTMLTRVVLMMLQMFIIIIIIIIIIMAPPSDASFEPFYITLYIIPYFALYFRVINLTITQHNEPIRRAHPHDVFGDSDGGDDPYPRPPCPIRVKHLSESKPYPSQALIRV